MRLLNHLVVFFLSIRLTVVCLSLLAILTVMGTLYQVEYGLYLAQERFFNSWYILFFGWLPFPGTQLVLTFLFFNLLANMLLRFSYGWRQFGIVLIHMGLILLLAGGWVTRRYGQESFLSLIEGETSNLASSYHEWEIAAWRDTPGSVREVVAYDTEDMRPGWTLDFPEFGVQLHVETFYANARAFRATDPAADFGILNASGLVRLDEERPFREPQENTPGGRFLLQAEDGSTQAVMLFGGDRLPTIWAAGGDEIAFSLRRKRHVLPMQITLNHFNRTFYPNTDIPRSFSSFIEVDLYGVVRPVQIEMNRPFRYQGYTFYQASYADLDQGRQLSTFAIVLNYGRVIPYVATGLTFLGLAIHFLIELMTRRRRST
jgi:hypothetical protein